MPTIVFETRKNPPKEIAAPDGGPLIDLCDNHNAPVPFSCRTASCGTCRITVLEGMDLLSEPDDEELNVLDVFADDPKTRRLACQAKVRAGAGRLRVRSVDEE